MRRKIIGIITSKIITKIIRICTNFSLPPITKNGQTTITKPLSFLTIFLLCEKADKTIRMFPINISPKPIINKISISIIKF